MKNIYKIFIALTALLACTSAFAEEGKSKMDSLILNKTATPNGDGTYTLKLDTYVLGDYTEKTTTIKTTKPVDFVLCLDVSGSMDDPLKGSPVLGTKKNYNNLDKIKGAREGYYAANRKGLITSSYKVIYRNGNWYYNRWGWIKIDDASVDVDIFKSKLGSLMDACDSFLDKIEASQKEGNLSGNKGHKVGVVSFASNAKDEIALTSIDNKSTIADKIHALAADGATAADYGMVRAKKMLNLDSNDGRGKVLVLFTDGEPNHGNNFDKDVANKCITVADSVKTEKASVFTISVLETTVRSDMWKYMNYVSSNYPNAKSLTIPGNQESDMYYQLCTNEEALNAAFETIAEEATSKEGGAAVQTDVSKTILHDVITPSFSIPMVDGTLMNSIKVYEVPVDVSYVPASHDAKDIKFVEITDDQKVTPEGVIPIPNIPMGSTNYSVDVTGFDFSAKWVGFRHASKDGQPAVWTVNPGSKLVIEIIIKPNADAEGGKITTNGPKSGIYIDGKISAEPEKRYPVPEVVMPKNLIIETLPLAEGKGESLLFMITDESGFSMMVSMTEGEGEIKDGKWTKAIAKLPIKDSEGNDIKYTVTPMTTWSWAYGETEKKTQKLSENNVYEFIPDAQTPTKKKHAENSANNVFAK